MVNILLQPLGFLIVEFGLRWSESVNRRTADRLQWSSGGGMVAMSMGYKNVCDGFFGKTFGDGRYVTHQPRAGVDDSHVSASNDIGPGSKVSKLAWVVGNYASDKRRNIVDFPIFKLIFRLERNMNFQFLKTLLIRSHNR